MLVRCRTLNKHCDFSNVQSNIRWITRTDVDVKGSHLLRDEPIVLFYVPTLWQTFNQTN